ncbi:hypothetical protein ES703_119690 [subsurface metagenome]
MPKGILGLVLFEIVVFDKAILPVKIDRPTALDFGVAVVDRLGIRPAHIKMAADIGKNHYVEGGIHPGVTIRGQEPAGGARVGVGIGLRGMPGGRAGDPRGPAFSWRVRGCRRSHSCSS